MKYLVMECHTAYAIVLDDAGRFLKVANLGYEVGQRLDSVVASHETKQKVRSWNKQITKFAAVAACLCVMILGAWQYMFLPQGTVQMSINPQVEMTVNRLNRVIKLEGLNHDGVLLVDGISGFGKEVELLADELADRAVVMGFLADGGQIALMVTGDEADWCNATEKRVQEELKNHFENRIEIIVVPAAQQSYNHQQTTEPAQPDSITIPVSPSNGDSDYGDSDYGDSNIGDDNNSDYGNSDDSDSNYSSTDSNSDYGDSDYGGSTGSNSDYSSADGSSNYGDSSYGNSDPNDDGDSAY